MEIIPAIIPKSKSHLLSSLEKLDGIATAIQIDLVDGVYAAKGSPSWPWSQGIFIDEMYMVFADLSERFDIEIDLMVEEPERFVEELVSASVSRLVVHVGSTKKLDDILAFRPHTKIGLAFTNDAPFDVLHAYHDKIDFVQCMGIAEIGSQGQPFDERVLARIKEIHAQYPSLEIAVDGGVTAETVFRLKEAGATRLIAGHAIVGASDPARAKRELEEIAQR